MQLNHRTDEDIPAWAAVHIEPTNSAPSACLAGSKLRNLLLALHPLRLLRQMAMAILGDDLAQLYEQLNTARKGYDEVLAENRELARKLKAHGLTVEPDR